MVDEARLDRLLRESGMTHRGEHLVFRRRAMEPHGFRYAAALASDCELSVAVRRKTSPYVLVWWRDDRVGVDEVRSAQERVSLVAGELYHVADDRSEEGVRLVLGDGYKTGRGSVDRTAEQLVECASRLLASITTVAGGLVGLRSASAFDERERSRPEPIDHSEEESATVTYSDALKDATIEHQALLIEFWDELADRGFDPGRGRKGSVEFDLGWCDPASGRRWLGEVKSIADNRSNEPDQIRRAIGQLIHYRYQLAQQSPAGAEIELAVLLRRMPDEPWKEICASAGICIRALRGNEA